MFEVHVSDDFMVDGVAIYISEKFGSIDRRILRIGENGSQTWGEIDPNGAACGPTIMLNGEAARALLDALLRHYQGASDMHTVRSDMLHERGRVDKLLGTISEIASRQQFGTAGLSAGTGRFQE